MRASQGAESSRARTATLTCYALWLTALFALSATACASVVTTPERGTQERQLILDAVRAPVEEALGLPVQFQVDTLRTDGHWAFLIAVPLDRQQQRIDYSQTPFADEVEAGLFEDWLCALLRKEVGEAWEVVALAIGPTDAPFVDWAERYGAPSAVIDPASTSEE